MLFSTKIASALFATTASAISARSAVVARHELAEISVIFFGEVSFTGGSFSPDGLVPGVCSTLPGDWLDRPESTQVGAGFTCTFFEFEGCEGPGTALSGNVVQLPGNLFNNIESFFCGKNI